MKDFSLKISEIKKVVSYATKKNGVPCELTGYSYSGPDSLGWMNVRCEVCTVAQLGKRPERVPDVEVCCMMADRRHSFVRDAH